MTSTTFTQRSSLINQFCKKIKQYYASSQNATEGRLLLYKLPWWVKMERAVTP